MLNTGKKHEEQVDSADQFFKDRESLWDAMPACWKKLTVSQRRKIFHLLHLFEDEASKEPSKGVWNIDNMRRVMEIGFVKYDDITKLRSSVLAATEDPSGRITLILCISVLHDTYHFYKYLKIRLLTRTRINL